jgi:hypothetical protein
MKIAIWRQPNEWCNPGVCTVDGENFGVSLERPWFHNQRIVSCVPAATYPLVIRHSPKFNRPMLTLDSVPGRSGILIHGANHWEDLKGCIAIAERRVDEERVQGDLSRVLMELVRVAFQRKEPVTIQTIDPQGEGVVHAG